MSKKGQTDWITVTILGILVLVTLIVVFNVSPEFFENLKEDLIRASSNILFALVAIGAGTFIVLFGVLYAPHNPKRGKTISYFGVAVMIIGLFIVEMAYVVQISEAVTTPEEMITKCGAAPTRGRGLFGDVNNPEEFLSCLITGYKYGKDYSGWSFLGFWIFGVLAPLLLLMFLFYDFVDASGVIQQPTSKKVVGFTLGLLAFRGFIISNLITLLSIGTVGIALLAIDLIFAGGLLAYVNRIFKQWKPVEEAQEIVESGKNAEYMLLGLLRSLKGAELDEARNILAQKKYLFEKINAIDKFHYLTDTRLTDRRQYERRLEKVMAEIKRKE